MNTLTYIGEELELFREAVNWKRYFGQKMRPWIRGSVLEVGAGLGETTPYLLHEGVTAWTCLEPDPRLLQSLEEKLHSIHPETPVTARAGTLENLEPGERFNTLLYIDVLEHIGADRAELEAAAGRLLPGGHLIVLSPAYQGLYNAFDKAIGHHRRYSRQTLRAAAALPGLREQSLFYLESMGVLLLLVNKALMRKSYPSRAQVRFWDRVVVPLSRIIDPLLGYSFGKTIVGVWQKEP
ncbi:MAG TPA: class I SAM-dependent methyltransferase [Chitinophagaceae bacterium]|jgi:SAM-dependent methyltransferase|nr:class I SAM-dependent methyltransferase [Chitinophagaceae bacterium]